METDLLVGPGARQQRPRSAWGVKDRPVRRAEWGAARAMALPARPMSPAITPTRAVVCRVPHVVQVFAGAGVFREFRGSRGGRVGSVDGRGGRRSQVSQGNDQSLSVLGRPVASVSSALQQLPGAGVARQVVGGALDRVGSVSPQARRAAVYVGAGVLGVAGVVEWPVAVAGAAAVWLTRPRPVAAAGPATPLAEQGGSAPAAPSAEPHGRTRKAAKGSSSARAGGRAGSAADAPPAKKAHPRRRAGG